MPDEFSKVKTTVLSIMLRYHYTGVHNEYIMRVLTLGLGCHFLCDDPIFVCGLYQSFLFINWTTLDSVNRIMFL